MTELWEKVARLRGALAEMGEVVVCFSGGVDSSYLLAEAVRVLGDSAVALTAVSPSLAREEGAAARTLADHLGVRHVLVETFELDDPRYAANPTERCYFCKTEVYGMAVEQAVALGARFVLDGFNVDDRGDHRPGRRAALELGVRSPLDEIGLTKAEIREAARVIDLPVWDKPALACLSSRFPYGTEITAERLAQVARAERAIRELGFRVVRVRYHGDLARLELGRDELPQLADPTVFEEVVDRLLLSGFQRAEVDPAGYRQGSLNEAVLPALVSIGRPAGAALD